MTLTFQQALDQIGLEDGPYNQYLKALELMFIQRGITDISWAEMGGSQHNFLSPMIGETSLVRIAQGYAGWVSMLLKNQVREPDSDWRLGLLRDPKLNLVGHAAHVKQYLKDNKIRYGTKKYKAFLAEKSEKARATLMQLGQDAHTDAVQQLNKALAENREKLANYKQGATFARRCAYILRALAVVANSERDETTMSLLEARAGQIDIMAARRAEYLDSVKVCDVKDIIEAAIRPYKEVADLWNYTP